MSLEAQSKINAKITLQNKWGSTKSLWKNLERISNVSGFQFTFPAEQQQSTADIPIHLHCRTKNTHTKKPKDCIPKSFISNIENNLFCTLSDRLWKVKATSKWHSLLRNKKSVVFYTQELGHLVPKRHFHQPPAMLQPGCCKGEMHCWEPQVSNNLSAEPWWSTQE